jgi:hypothetical protein
MAPEPSGGTVTELYERRFSAAEREAKDALWRVLCEDFFQRWVSPDARLVDLGAGMCEFVNHIRARERWAVDSDPQVARRAAPGVETHCGPAHDLGWLATDSVDVVFASNVFEQFRSTEDLLAVLREVRSVLRRAVASSCCSRTSASPTESTYVVVYVLFMIGILNPLPSASRSISITTSSAARRSS